MASPSMVSDLTGVVCEYASQLKIARVIPSELCWELSLCNWNVHCSSSLDSMPTLSGCVGALSTLCEQFWLF